MKKLLSLFLFSALSIQAQFLINPFQFGGGGGGGGITTSLISHWKFNSNGNDSHGANNLTATSITYEAGMVSDAARFTSASSSRFAVASNSDLQVGDTDYTISFWFRLTSFAGFFMNKGDNSVGDEYYIYNEGSAPCNAKFYCAGSLAVHTQSISLDTWYHLIAWYDSAANQSKIIVTPASAGTLGSTVTATAGSANTVKTSPVNIGCYRGNSNFLNGLMDSPFFWKRHLTTDEMNAVYAAGLGYELP